MSSESWLGQNKHFLLQVSLQLLVILLLAFVLLPLGDRTLSVWREITSPAVLPEADELERQIAFWTQNNEQLDRRLDSLTTAQEGLNSSESQLAFIQSAVPARGLSLISCDVRSVGQEDDPSTAFDLELQGGYREIGILIATLERSDLRPVVDRMILERAQGSSRSLKGSLTMIVGARKEK